MIPPMSNKPAGACPIRQDYRSDDKRRQTLGGTSKLRAKEEVRRMSSENGAIEKVKARLAQQKCATADQLKTIDKDVRDIVADAADFAQSDPEPDASELYTDIYVES